jgi:hypothetical protein
MLPKKKEKKAAGVIADMNEIDGGGPPRGLAEIQRQKEKQRMGSKAPEESKPLYPFGEDYQKAELAKSQAEMEKTAMEKRKSQEILARGMRGPRRKLFGNLKKTLGVKEDY